ncbi:UNVERIFIED_CONTAM: phage tail family protein, partial [Bacteroidetes bacterium 56_B9]
NMFDIRKVGDKVTFFWYGSYYSYYENRIKNLEAKRIQYFVGQYAGQASTKLVTRTYINDLSFQKLGVETWKDIPNRYPSGSSIKI